MVEKNPEIGEKPKDNELGLELGIEQNLPFATPYSPTGTGGNDREKANQELRELLRSDFGEDTGPTVAQLIAMRRLDGQARALYRLLTLPIRAALSKSTFVPADGGEKEAEFIDQVFNLPPAQGGMSVTFHHFMSQLLQGLFDGFAPFEQVYWKPAYGPLKGKYTIKKLAYRQPDTVTVIEDMKGHFEGFRQQAQSNGEVIDIHIPKERCFYFAAQEEERKYYGVSYFQSAFYHYDKKIKMYYIAHLAAQRAAVGTRVGTHPVTATTPQKQVFAQNLSNLAFAQWMMVPDNFKVEMLKEGGTFGFLDYINHHNNQMSKSVLANFFDKDSGGGAGDAKLVSFGQPGDEMFVLMLHAIMDDIANSINHYIIPRLIDWNFKGGKYPKFQWAALTDEQKNIIFSTFDKLSVAGQSMLVTPEFLRELEKIAADELGLEIDWEVIEEREAVEKETQNLMQGIGPDGKPLPVDPSTGAPVMPGQPNPGSSLQDFEAAASGGAPLPAQPAPVNEEMQKELGLSGDEQLVTLAKDLLARADIELAGERFVRTEQGEKLFGKPIGSPIGGAEPKEDPPGRGVTIERLMSLKAQMEEFNRAGNKTAAVAAAQALKDAVAVYTGTYRPSEFFKVMDQLAAHNKSGKGGVVAGDILAKANVGAPRGK